MLRYEDWVHARKIKTLQSEEKEGERNTSNAESLANTLLQYKSFNVPRAATQTQNYKHYHVGQNKLQLLLFI